MKCMIVLTRTHSAISVKSFVDVLKSCGRTEGFRFPFLDADIFSASRSSVETVLTALLCWGKTGRLKVLA